MRFTELLIPTLREAPADAEVMSHKLMVRAGYIRKSAAGIYTYLPLCLLVLNKIEKIIREEMHSAGALELLMPMVLPAELWQETGRWEIYGKELLRFKDRHDRDFCLGPTHEEMITEIVRNEVRSWRDLPKNLFQIQTKFRDEIRPRFGLMRGREFIMKDCYSFDRDEESSKKTYQRMYDAYQKIFKRCGLKFRAVEAMTGTIGGSLSHEFQVLAASGEDEIVSCNKCSYAANVEKAELKSPHETKPSAKGGYKKVKTPGRKTVEEVCEFLDVRPERLVKTIIVMTDSGPAAALVRGDHHFKESKLKEVLSAQWCNFASDQEVEKLTRAPVGFAGPIGLNFPIVADLALLEMDKFVVGANEQDHHFTEVSRADLEGVKFADIRRAVAGDPCPRCDGKYEEHRGIEVGQVFYLGTKYSKAMEAVYLDEKGAKLPIIMGCYGIGVSRTAAAAIEQHHDDRGIIWPVSIAPFEATVLPLSASAEVMSAAMQIYEDLKKIGVEAMIDDRDERAGVKFADADLTGVPYHIVVGEKGLKTGTVEIKSRRTKETVSLAPKDAAAKAKALIEDERGSYESR